MTKNGGMPDVSIIICTYGRAALLERTLLSLARVSGIGQAEVLVVDNGSPDDTASVAKRCAEALAGQVPIRCIHEPRQGLSIARNTGIAHARAPILAFLDDDAVPVSGWLSALRQSVRAHPRAGAFGGPVQPEFETERPEWLVGRLELPYTIVDLGDHERRYPRNLYPFGANMAVRREALGDGLRFPESLGRKGAALYSGEEGWLFSRLRKNGWPLMYVPGMRVSHFIPAERLTPEWIRKRYYYQGVSFAKSHTGLTGMIRIVTTLALRRLYIAIQWRLADTPGKRLWAECRRESVRGAMRLLEEGDVHAG